MLILFFNLKKIRDLKKVGDFFMKNQLKNSDKIK